MKYRALNKGFELIGEDELLYKLLKDRGVENPQEFLNIDGKVIHDGMFLRNMDRGLNMLHWHIENGSRIHILDDCDTDGVTAATIIDNYIRDIDKNIVITHSMNDNKNHGIILKNLEDYDFDLLIIPDAGSDDAKKMKILCEERDIDILNIDHHTLKEENPYAIVINCQDGQYPNNTLSGSAMVYKFIKEYDKKYGYNYADKYLDLCAIGIISDSMDLRNYETRYLAMQGLKQINNEFVKEFMIKNKIENDKINFEFVGWKIAPFINAVTRVGKKEEKNDLISAFIGENKTKEYQPRRKKKDDPKPPIEIQTIQKAMIRECTNIKSRQDKLVTKGMEKLIEIIKEHNLDKNKVIIADGTDILEKSFTGLVANKLANLYKRPVIILKKMKEEKGEIIYGGSYRNYNLFPVVSLMVLFKEIGTFDKLGGHPNSGGFKIKHSRLKETQDKLNEILKDIEIEDVYLVDYEVPVGRLKEKHIRQVGQWANIWGNTLKKPLFCISNINLSIEDVKLLGDKKNFIRIEKNIGNNKIVFVKKFASEEIYNKMIMKHSKGLSKRNSTKIKMDIIGEFAINEWEGNQFPQIEIVDFNVETAKEFRF